MIKNYLSLAFAILFATGASAETLSPAEALARAGAERGMERVSAAVKADPQLVYTASTADGSPAVYIFAHNDDGYMVLSADDVALPLLGYADSGSADPADMAPAMRWWLDEYARQIQWARSRGAAPAQVREVKEGRRDVPKMIQTTWDQGEPYNQLCPVVNGHRAYTGCVATSMSQIMYYFKYPEVGRGKISYTDEEGCGKRLTWNFADYPFVWDDMLLSYKPGKYTADQGLAVAELMKSAGASVKMSYGADASGALSMNTAYALVKYFDYDPNIDYMLRSYVSATRWDELVYENLADVGPVLYGGASMLGGGHSFIIDGYEAATGLFHFNWGWSELSDGYYSLDALNPSSLGAGGGDGGGYNFTQDAVFGIQPPTGKPAETRPLRLTLQGTIGGSVKNGSLTVQIIEEAQPMWINYSPYDMEVILGISIQKKTAAEARAEADTTIVPLSELIDLPVGHGVSQGACRPLDLTALDLEDGEYILTSSALVTNIKDQTWQPVQENHGYSNSMILTKNGTRYRLDTTPGNFYTVDEVSIEYELYYGCLAKFHYKVTNNNDIEISRGIAPMLYTAEGSPAFLGNSKMLSIMPGETVEGDIVTELYSMSQSIGSIYEDTELYLTLFDETSYRVMADQIFGKVILHPAPGAPKITMTSPLTISNATFNDKTSTYEVTDASDIRINATVTLNDGYLAYPLLAVILGAPDAQGNAEVLDYLGDNVFLTEPGETYDFDNTYNFKEPVIGRVYYMSLALGVGSTLVPITHEIRFKVVETSGIDDIEADTAAEAIYYNLQGLAVDYDTAPAGIYIRRTADTTAKVVKK